MTDKFNFLRMFRNVISFKTSVRDIGRCKRELIDLKTDITEDMNIDEIRTLIDEKLTNINFITNELRQRAVASDARFHDYLRKHSSQERVNGITITDHAIVRYLERGIGINIKELLTDMLESAHVTSERMGQRNPHTAVWYSIPSKGVKLIAYGKNIVTIIPDD